METYRDQAGMYPLSSMVRVDGAPTGQAPGTSMKYPPTPPGAETLRCASARASAGYPPVAESAVALTQGHGDDLAAQSPHLSTGRARGLLRRRIKIDRTAFFK